VNLSETSVVFYAIDKHKTIFLQYQWNGGQTILHVWYVIKSLTQLGLAILFLVGILSMLQVDVKTYNAVCSSAVSVAWQFSLMFLW